MKRIEDRNGTKYRLEDTRLFEPQLKGEFYDNAREVKRSELRKALKALDPNGIETGYVNYYYSRHLTKAGHLRERDTSNVRLFINGDTIGIGCCIFEAANGRALQRWAR